MEQRVKPIEVLCSDTRAEIPPIVETAETMQPHTTKCSAANNLSDGLMRSTPDTPVH